MSNWYDYWTKEYNDLCNSRWKDTRDKMAVKFKNADDYILKEYMKPTMQTYVDIDMRMNYLHDFVVKNYDKDKDKFHEISGRYSHEFNRYHGILKQIIKELKKSLKNTIMKPASDLLQNEAKGVMSNCTYFIFEYENKLREFGFLIETFTVESNV